MSARPQPAFGRSEANVGFKSSQHGTKNKTHGLCFHNLGRDSFQLFATQLFAIRAIYKVGRRLSSPRIEVPSGACAIEHVGHGAGLGPSGVPAWATVCRARAGLYRPGVLHGSLAGGPHRARS